MEDILLGLIPILFITVIFFGDDIIKAVRDIAISRKGCDHNWKMINESYKQCSKCTDIELI